MHLFPLTLAIHIVLSLWKIRFQTHAEQKAKLQLSTFLDLGTGREKTELNSMLAILD